MVTSLPPYHVLEVHPITSHFVSSLSLGHTGRRRDEVSHSNDSETL